jgi:hypothetical protein
LKNNKIVMPILVQSAIIDKNITNSTKMGSTGKECWIPAEQNMLKTYFQWLFVDLPILKSIFMFFFGSATPCASPPPRPSIFSDYYFWVHHLVNGDERHLLAHAMASDFSVPQQCLSKRTIGFLLRVKAHALI